MTTRILFALFVVTSFWACGSDSVTTPEQPAIERGIHEVGILTQPRYRHISTLLPNGKVLIAGGLAQLPADDTTSSASSRIFRPAGLLISAEIFDPVTGTSSPTGDMTVGRDSDNGILLPDGRVLIIPRYLNLPIEMCDAHSGRFDAVAIVPLKVGIWTATLLPNGEVFLISGTHAGVFDPTTGTFPSIFAMDHPGIGHTATLLKDGRVLIVGGGRRGIELLGRSLIYDPSSKAFSEAGDLQFDRVNHKAMLLQDGRVLIIGGKAGTGPFVHTAEMYDPETNSFSPAGVSTIDPSAALLLPSGNVFLIRSINGDIVLYDPATHAFSPTGYSIAPWRTLSSVTLLEDGRVMIAGGWKYRDSSTQSGDGQEREITDQVLIFTP